MKYTKLLILLIVLCFGVLCVSYVWSGENKNTQLDNNFYTINEVCPELNGIFNDIGTIRSEVQSVRDDMWPDWPEKNLYETPAKKWNIFPFKAFGVKVSDSYEKCPKLGRFIDSIPGIKVALLSKLSPGMKLSPHQGWGNHSNHVIRCHFGIDIPKGCYVGVNDEIQQHIENDWIAFDDSKFHYAHNPTDKDRIVLIVDVVRPPWIKPGVSDVEDTAELLKIVQYYRDMENSKK